MTAREVPLWVGKTPDSAIPARVRLRVFQREGGRCWLSGRKILPGDAWEMDHKVALINGGSHSEDNLAPALKAAHRAKTNADVAEKAKVDRIAKKHLGLTKPGSRWPARCRKMDGSIGLTKRAQRQAARPDDEQVGTQGDFARSEQKILPTPSGGGAGHHGGKP